MAVGRTQEQAAYEKLTTLSSGGQTLGNILPKVEQFVFYLGIGVCIIFIILAGYQYFFGEDSSSKTNTQNAQKTLTYAVVAFIILLLLRVIFIIIARIFGFNFNPTSITK